MYEPIYKPATIVRVSMGVYDHYALTSDRYHNGKPNLISLTSRKGTAEEEAWDHCVGNKQVVKAEIQSNLPPAEVLARARSKIGKESYSLFGYNCEHFVNWAAGLEVNSSQVNAGIVGATVGVGVVSLLAEKPSFLKFLTGALLLGVLAVDSTR